MSIGRSLTSVMLGGASALAMGAVAAPAFAANAADQAAATATVGDIIVTAEKRAEPLQKVSDAVTAVTAEKLQEINANGFQDFYRLVPGLTVTPGSQGENTLSIRGLQSSNFTGPTVGVYIDDTPIGSSVAGDHANSLVPDLDPSDLARVDVLRGPQGTLYGAAALGGLVKFVTAQPDLEHASGRVEVDGENVDHGGWGYLVRGAATGPIVSDKLALRVSGYYRQDPGFIDDPGVIHNPTTNQSLSGAPRSDINSSQVYGGRIAALWKPTDDVSVRLSALYQHHHDDGQTAEDIDGLTQKPLEGSLEQVDSPFTGPDNVSLQVYNAAIDWDLHWATLLSSTSYAVNDFASSTDITGLVPPSPTSGFPPVAPAFLFPNAGAGYFTFPVLPTSYFTPVDLAFRTRKVTEELRLTSPTEQRIEWQLGFFYTDENNVSNQQITIDNPATGVAYPITGVCAPPFAVPFPAPPPPMLPACAAIHIVAPAGTPFHRSGASTDYTEYAGYGDVTLNVTKQFAIEAGLRYSVNHENFSSHFNGVLDALSTGKFSDQLSGAFSGHDLTYLVAPKYQITDNVMVYGRVSTGYRPGGANHELPGEPTTFQPDTTTNYEVGAKTTFLGGRAMVDVAAYLIDWDHIQLESTDALGFFFFVNGGKAQSSGVELETEFEPVNGLILRANAAYNDAVLSENIPASAGVAGFKGDRLPYSPLWSADLSADYRFDVGRGWSGKVGGDYQYVGDELIDFSPCAGSPVSCAVAANLPPARARLASYDIINLRAGLSRAGWDINLFVKNAGDDLAFTQESVQHGTFAFAVPHGKSVPDSATVLTPRTIGVSVARTF